MLEILVLLGFAELRTVRGQGGNKHRPYDCYVGDESVNEANDGLGSGMSGSDVKGRAS